MNRVGGIEEGKGRWREREKSMLPSIFNDGYWFEGGELLMKEFGGGESYLSLSSNRIDFCPVKLKAAELS